MSGKMPCHISDGPQTPEDVYEPPEIDEDAAYEWYRQHKIDMGECMTCTNKVADDKIYCEDCEDPTPWCTYCGARDKKDCQCGPLAPTR